MNLREQIEENIEWLSRIGRDDTGGTTRLLYTNEWLEAQRKLKNKWEAMGMTAAFDDIGNLYGRVAGTDGKETILTGSHVDTVIHGGRLDGQFGIVAGYLAINYLVEKYGQPYHNLEVISMAEEEGSRFPMTFWGSRNLLGIADNEQAKELVDLTGASFVEEMKRCGFGFNLKQERRKDIRAFIEMHIEQGGILEHKQVPIGIVENIVGMKVYNVKLTGAANHAGTTPINMRKDGMYGYSQICSRVITRGREIGEPLVVTFGKIKVTPNSTNVVPGEVEFSIDTRHPNSKELNKFAIEIEKIMREVSKELELELSYHLVLEENPVEMSSEMIQIVEAVVTDNEIPYHKMSSGAGHDSQNIAQFFPTGMIFVPSRKGISHSPLEATSIEDLVIGVETLAKTLYRLAYI